MEKGTSTNANEIQLWTDGSHKNVAGDGYQGVGGWAWMSVNADGAVNSNYGARTGCRDILLMEMLAIDEGLKNLEPGSDVFIYSDSMPAVCQITNLIAFDSVASSVERQDIRSSLSHILGGIRRLGNVQVAWVPGHCGTEKNEQVDDMARQAMRNRVRGLRATAGRK